MTRRQGKSNYEDQEDSNRFHSIEKDLKRAKDRISELEETIGKLAPLIAWITPERQVVVETKYIPVKCDRRFDFRTGETECRPIKQLNDNALPAKGTQQ